ncbi:hypothetical protein LINPERPRIM_LOCUS354 [Linum perenne]
MILSYSKLLPVTSAISFPSALNDFVPRQDNSSAKKSPIFFSLKIPHLVCVVISVSAWVFKRLMI